VAQHACTEGKRLSCARGAGGHAMSDELSHRTCATLVAGKLNEMAPHSSGAPRFGFEETAMAAAMKLARCRWAHDSLNAG